MYRFVKIIQMETLVGGTMATIININFNLFPKGELLGIVAGTMFIDFLTGVLKAFFTKDPITSRKLRATISKFTQYGGAILIGMIISLLVNTMSIYQPDWSGGETAISWSNNGLLVLIIAIEIKSIFENLYAMNTKNVFAKKVLGPMIRILTVKINDNPIAKYAAEEDSKTKIIIDEEVVTVKEAEEIDTIEIKDQNLHS